MLINYKYLDLNQNGASSYQYTKNATNIHATRLWKVKSVKANQPDKTELAICL